MVQRRHPTARRDLRASRPRAGQRPMLSPNDPDRRSTPPTASRASARRFRPTVRVGAVVRSAASRQSVAAPERTALVWTPTSFTVAPTPGTARTGRLRSTTATGGRDSAWTIAIWVSSVNSPGSQPKPPPPVISPMPPSTGSGNVARVRARPAETRRGTPARRRPPNRSPRRARGGHSIAHCAHLLPRSGRACRARRAQTSARRPSQSCHCAASRFVHLFFCTVVKARSCHAWPGRHVRTGSGSAVLPGPWIFGHRVADEVRVAAEHVATPSVLEGHA